MISLYSFYNNSADSCFFADFCDTADTCLIDSCVGNELRLSVSFETVRAKSIFFGLVGLASSSETILVFVFFSGLVRLREY